MESTRSSGPSSMLAPGLRFHPTDEELVRYYLKRKVCGKALRFDAISEIDIYKSEPWDLPSMSKLNSRDLEWYFFSVLGKKYGNGAKTNRATEKGYWKTTGKDRTVYGGKQIVGMKKTLVYHNGKAPKGQRTNWVMHEYRLVNLELETTQDAFVLCRVYQKSGSGPKNGERYGAPFVEEEWEDDELEFVPKEEAAEEIEFGEDAYLDSHDIEQILASDVPSDIVPLPFNFNAADGNWGEETAESVNDTQNILVPAGKKYDEPEQYLDTNFSDLSALYDTCMERPKHEYIGESDKSGNSQDLDFLFNEPFLDAFGDLQNDGGFFEANNPVENDSASFDMLEEYLPFFDANGEYSENFVYDPSVTMGVVNTVSDQALLTENQPNEGTSGATLPSGQFIDNNDKVALLSADKQETTNLFQSDYQLRFIKQASQMLSNVPAPPAFAAEFPSKDAILRLNSMALSPSSAHVASGMIQVRNLDEHKNFNIVLSFGFARGADGSASLGSSVSIFPGKTFSAIFRSGFYFIFLWVLIFSMSNKIGTYFCASQIS